jgi:hypothetical protein
MAHFAKIENGIVTNVIVVNNEVLQNKDFPESETIGQSFLASLNLDGEWLQTSYNANFRGVYAGIGYTYNNQLDKFQSPESKETASNLTFNNLTETE